MSICVGCGLKVDSGTGLLEVERRPNGGIDCTNTGAATDGLFLDIWEADTATIDMVGNGTQADPIRANVITAGLTPLLISGDACNGITNHGGQLYSPCPRSLAASNNMSGIGGGVIPFGITGPNNTYGRLSNCAVAVPAGTCAAGGGTSQIVFTNPTCSTIEGFWEWICYGGVITGASSDFDATGILTTSINNGAYGENPQTNMKYYGDADKTVFELGGYHAKNYNILGPGASFQVSAQFVIFVATGSATWAVEPNFEVYAHFTQTGAC